MLLCAGRKPKRLKKARAAALAEDGSELEASLGGAPAARRPAPAARKNHTFVRPSSALSDRQCAPTHRIQHWHEVVPQHWHGVCRCEKQHAPSMCR